MQPRPLEEWITKGYQRDANLSGAYAYPRATDECSLARGAGGYNQGSFVYFPKMCEGWVFAGVSVVFDFFFLLSHLTGKKANYNYFGVNMHLQRTALLLKIFRLHLHCYTL